MPSAGVRIGAFIALHTVVRAGGAELEYVHTFRHLPARSADLYLEAQVILYRPVVGRPPLGQSKVTDPFWLGRCSHEHHV